MRVAVLALQGAFIEHERMLQRLGVETFEIRQLSDWQQPKDGLIIPGGESTVQLKLLKDLGLLEPIVSDIKNGLPVFGTCAGLILLAKTVEGQQFSRISTMDIDVRRNAYGRQLGSFYVESKVEGVGDDVPMTFIRSPFIKYRAMLRCLLLLTDILLPHSRANSLLPHSIPNSMMILAYTSTSLI